MAASLLALLLLAAAAPCSLVDALDYVCATDQVLVVQSLDVQSLRMHCAKFDLCGKTMVRHLASG